ncbi:glycosyltransferase family 4 protein, partial [Escherichia coli]|nr:glycosyltransferase family 4 protein [Escherichia coli]
MQKVSILIADITCVGGIERVICLLANALANYGFKVEIISLYRTNANINYALNKDIKVTFINKLKYSGKPGGYFRLFKHILSAVKLNKHLLANKNSFFIINTFPMAFISMPFILFSKNTCVVEHVYHSYYSKPIQYIRQFIYKFITTIVALTDTDAEKYKRGHRHVVKIPNPLSFVECGESTLRNHKIIAVGRLEYQKGFDLLIQAFARASKDTDWSLDIYGDGTLRKELEEIIQFNEISNINLLGNVSNIDEIYKDYSLFVFSSRFEGFGMVLLEAMRAGLPCISFNCPTGPAEIFDNGEYGILVDNGNIDELSNVMKMFMDSFELRSKFSKLSIIRTENYTLDKILPLWVDLIN